MRAAPWTRRARAVRVAAVAAVLTALTYAAVAVVLNVALAHRLLGEVDTRLGQRLAEVGTLQVGSQAEAANDAANDADEVPIFVWRVSPEGGSTTLTPSGPALPARTWTSAPVTLDLAGIPFRFDAKPGPGGGWTVAGVSVNQIAHVQSDLVMVELLVGGLLVVLVYLGALVVGLRVSAPFEMVTRRQAEFTADASHELRTPLSVIEAEVGLALSRQRSSSEYRDTLERVAGESRRLRQIVDDLLWLARADAERPAPGSLEPVDLPAVTAACVQRFGAVASSREVTLRFERADDEAVFVRATPELVDRLVGVLVDNACRHAGPGGTVRVSVGTLGGHALLRVEDTGPGIPSEQRARVLDRFHRATDEPGGTGLGLAIADSAVRATHGAWTIGQSVLGGALLEVAWRRAAGPAGGWGRPPAASTGRDRRRPGKGRSAALQR